jgi:AcrR family transcriptional regulator
MPRRRKDTTAPRKLPKQARSTRLVEHILQAAVRVLERDGAAGFNTVRVAERAGVSVGSLYQYFPNKQAILFRLQQDEWAGTSALLDGIFEDERRSAAERLRAAMRAFFASEFDEAPLRRALGDAAPLYRDAPEAQEHRARGMPLLAAVVAEAAPRLPRHRRAFVCELFVAAMTSIGKHASELARKRSDVDAWADATADMFLAYLQELQRRR